MSCFFASLTFFYSECSIILNEIPNIMQKNCHNKLKTVTRTVVFNMLGRGGLLLNLLQYLRIISIFTLLLVEYHLQQLVFCLQQITNRSNQRFRFIVQNFSYKLSTYEVLNKPSERMYLYFQRFRNYKGSASKVVMN